MNDVLADPKFVRALLKLDLVETLETSSVSIDADLRAGDACRAQQKLGNLENAFCITKTIFRLMGASYEFDEFIEELAVDIEHAP